MLCSMAGISYLMVTWLLRIVFYKLALKFRLRNVTMNRRENIKSLKTIQREIRYETICN